MPSTKTSTNDIVEVPSVAEPVKLIKPPVSKVEVASCETDNIG